MRTKSKSSIKTRYFSGHFISWSVGVSLLNFDISVIIITFASASGLKRFRMRSCPFASQKSYSILRLLYNIHNNSSYKVGLLSPPNLHSLPGLGTNRVRYKPSHLPYLTASLRPCCQATVQCKKL